MNTIVLVCVLIYFLLVYAELYQRKQQDKLDRHNEFHRQLKEINNANPNSGRLECNCGIGREDDV